ncbi:antibiotic biosynthesis monooxygenase [uncultured Jatrophihabitans sp.]|uniref:antibiotic biosynthesis monooxygenase n=1 Tax=uncultured Jatrophihabitans sp. TaxID=1610747 RepID=UPI0035CC3835
MIAITHFTDEGDAFLPRARPALEALSKCVGYRRGSIGRCTDDTDAWVLITEWANVGSYRRALGTWDVKLHATPLLALARDLPSGFESLVEIAAGGETTAHASDREPDA